MAGFLQDLRFGARGLAHNPLHTAVVIGTLVVGIAACTLVAGIVNAVFYRPYDAYSDAGRLVFLFERNARQNTIGLASAANMNDWQRAARSFERMGGMGRASLALTGSGEPETLTGVAATDAVLDLLDARPQCGRLFDRTDYAAPAPNPVLLADALWRRRFGGGCDVVGRVVTLNGQPRVVAGVLARSVRLRPLLGFEPEIVVPLAVDAAADRADRAMVVVARLKPGVSPAQASTEMQAIAERLAANDAADRGWDVYVKQARGLDLQSDAGFVVVLGVAVAFVLSIVCANVANLLLVRAAARAREIATRRAMGAGVVAIVRLVLAETLMLGAAGSAGALVLAWWACRGLAWWISGTNIGAFDLQVDLRVSAVAVGLSALTALVAGGVAAWHLARIPVTAGLSSARHGGTRSPAGRVRQFLVASQIALALVLLVGAGLVLRGVVNLRQNDAGFRAAGLVTAFTRLSDARYEPDATRTTFVEQVLARLVGSRDVESAAASDFIPLAGSEVAVVPFAIEGRPSEQAAAGVIGVSDGYFRTLGIAQKAGRVFGAGDRAGAVPVVIVNQRLVRRWFGDRSPLGARLRVHDTWRTVVGVVGDVRNFHLNVAPAPTMYVPFGQRPAQVVAVLARMRSGDAAMLPAFKAAVRAIDPNQPVNGGEPLERLVQRSMGGFDMTAVVVGLLALVALTLASVGVFGVVGNSVARRTHEIGVRMALGASPGRVVGYIVWREARVALVGGGVPGLLLAAGAGRLLASKLPRVAAIDPLVFGAALLAMLTTVLVAAYVPARRAAGVNPSVATRVE